MSLSLFVCISLLSQCYSDFICLCAGFSSSSAGVSHGQDFYLRRCKRSSSKKYSLIFDNFQSTIPGEKADAVWQALQQKPQAGSHLQSLESQATSWQLVNLVDFSVVTFLLKQMLQKANWRTNTEMQSTNLPLPWKLARSRFRFFHLYADVENL